VASIQAPFDLYRCSTQPGANFFPHHSPAISVPTDRVVLSDLAGYTHAQNFFQAMFSGPGVDGHCADFVLPP
jgi:hypothetical protein